MAAEILGNVAFSLLGIILGPLLFGFLFRFFVCRMVADLMEQSGHEAEAGTEEGPQGIIGLAGRTLDPIPAHQPPGRIAASPDA